MTNDFNPADRDAVKQKYEQERARRLRADGVAQYIPMSGQFAGMSDDPHTEKMERQPVIEEAEAVVVGAGFGGILSAARLKEAGDRG